ncbi:hypothetical protein DRJ48_04700, partial [Candidatus Woesearchaeota archaeon]
QITDKTKKLQAIDGKLEQLKAQLEATNKRIKELENEIAQKQKEIDNVNSEIEQKGEKGQVDLHKRIENLRVEISANTARIESCKQEISKIREREGHLRNQLDELKEKMKGLEREIALMQQDKAKLEEEQRELSNRLNQLKQKYKIGDTAKLEAEIDAIDAETEEISNTLLNLKEEQQALMREKDRLEIQLSNIDQRIAKIAEIELKNKKELEMLKRTKLRFKQVTVELNRLLNEDSALASKLATVRKHLIEAREELAKLKERKSSLHEKIAGNIAVKRVLELRNKIPGIHGSVSSLGSVKSKYALALDVAAGPHLRDVVVEDEATAVKCIKFLKENKLGIATFLPIKNLRQFQISNEVKRLAGASGVHGLAIDLIKYDPKYEKVFRFVFRDTLVVENLDVARRLGVGTVRMVTLDGDLVEVSGAMIGGYRRRQTQALGFQEEEVTKHLTEVEARVAELTKQIDKLEATKQETEERIDALRREKGELEGQIIKAEKSLHLDSEDLSASQKEKEILKANLKSVEQKLSQLMKEISKVTTNLTSKKMMREKLKQQLSAMRDTKVLAEIDTYEERIRKIKEEIVAIDGRIHNNRVQREEVFGKEAKRIEQILKQLSKEEKSFSDEITKRQEKDKELNKKLKEMEKKAEDFYSKYKQLFKRRNQLADAVRNLEKEKLELSDKTRQIELKMNSISLERATLKAQLSGLEEEFKQYSDVELLKGKSLSELKREIERYESMVQNLGSVNLRALEIYEEVEREYQQLLEKREKLLKEKEDVEKMMSEIEGKKKVLFLETFEKLNKYFTQMFTKLSTKGGEAYLVLENPENPFDGGALIKVRLSGSRFKDIRSLSGGEKALTALALIFAIQEYEPAPFYIMDEVDAALDKQNSEKLAKLISSYAKQAQYIVISHNDYIIQNADTLFGVSMTEHGISKVVSLKV